MDRIILASGSQGRRELFEQHFGLNFMIQASGVEEEDLFSLSPQDMVCQLAQRKSSFVAQEYPEDFVFAFDTTVSCEGKCFGKPQNLDEAEEMLCALNHKMQTVWTGYAMEYKGFQKSGTAYAELVISLTEQEIQSYLQEHPVINFAGAYAIQTNDIYITVLSGDMDTIIGAPMGEVYAFLKQFSKS